MFDGLIIRTGNVFNVAQVYGAGGAHFAPVVRKLIERRNRLWELIKPAEGKIQFSHHIETEGRAFFQAVDAMELEGIVSKKANSRYFSGPSKAWLKTKCFAEAEFEIAGVLREPGQAPQALMAQQRKYVGSAIVALSDRMRERLYKRVHESAGPPPKGVRKPEAAIRPPKRNSQ